MNTIIPAEAGRYFIIYCYDAPNSDKLERIVLPVDIAFNSKLVERCDAFPVIAWSIESEVSPVTLGGPSTPEYFIFDIKTRHLLSSADGLWHTVDVHLGILLQGVR